MDLKILVTPRFAKDEYIELQKAAADNRLTPSEFIRRAVQFYSAVCVPTHSDKPKLKTSEK